MPQSKSTIRFTAELLTADAIELPKSASAKLPSQGATTVEGTINGFPFRAAIKAHSLKLTNELRNAAAANIGDIVTIEITRIGEESEPRLPIELQKSLSSSPPAESMWAKTTPAARRDWILWITSAKKSETRQLRIEKACSMLASGKRRVCCFGGLNWLTKDHPSVKTWLPARTTVRKLPNS